MIFTFLHTNICPGVWAALQPALLMVTRVINSGHPFWNALMSIIYHVKQVPTERDPREPVRGAGKFSSIWLTEVADDELARVIPLLLSAQWAGADRKAQSALSLFHPGYIVYHLLSRIPHPSSANTPIISTLPLEH